MAKENNTRTDALTLSLGILAVAGLRVLMAPYPNIEPIMLSTIVTGLLFGPVTGFLMGAGSMVVSNFLMAPGPLTFPWLLMMPLVTIYTSLSYGLVGILSGVLGRLKKGWGRMSLAGLAAAMTILYDAITAFCFGLQFYGPTGVYSALIAQLPFTLLHLSNAVLALLLAPYLFKAAYGARNAVYTAYQGVKTLVF